MHHEDDVEDNEEVVRVPEDLIVGHPEKNRYHVCFKRKILTKINWT